MSNTVSLYFLFGKKIHASKVKSKVRLYIFGFYDISYIYYKSVNELVTQLNNINTRFVNHKLVLLFHRVLVYDITKF